MKDFSLKLASIYLLHVQHEKSDIEWFDSQLNLQIPNKEFMTRLEAQAGIEIEKVDRFRSSILASFKKDEMFDLMEMVSIIDKKTTEPQKKYLYTWLCEHPVENVLALFSSKI